MTPAILQDRRILDAFSDSGYLFGGNEHEIVMFGGCERACGTAALDVRTLQQFADYRGQGALKMAYATSRRKMRTVDGRQSPPRRVSWRLTNSLAAAWARYWRLIVPGSGLLRRQWLEGIKKRAESMPNRPS